MFLDEPDRDFTLEEWEDCRNFYLRSSQQPGMEENLVFACRERARYAAENVRRSTREIEILNAQWHEPAFIRR